MPDHAALHEPHAALLRAALLAASPPGARAALDLACGAGAKTAWLAACAAPGALVLGLDFDPAALRAAPVRNRVAADAHALPLRPASLDLIWCVAALGLFAAPKSQDEAKPLRALAEARRALRPGGALVVATASERWVRPRRWPPALASALPAAPLPAPADDLGADLRELLAAAGLRDIGLAAYLLDPPGLAPAAALLPLLDEEALRPYAGAGLSLTEAPEPEPLPVLLVARGSER